MFETDRASPPLVKQLWMLADAFEGRLTRELEGLGLTLAEFRLVGHVMGAPQGLRQSELAARLGVKAPTVSTAVRRLEQSGVLQRRPDPSDPRARLVSIAPDAPLSPGLDVLGDVQERAARGLSGEQVEQLIHLVDHVVANLVSED